MTIFNLFYSKVDHFQFVSFIVGNNKGQGSIETVREILTDSYQLDFLAKILQDNFGSHNKVRLFEFEHVRYVFNARDELFVRLRQFDEIATTNQLIHAGSTGLRFKERFVL